MSWGIQLVGDAQAVAKRVDVEFGRHSCPEPEENVRQAARLAIEAALRAQADGTVVRVSASGSQSSHYKGSDPHHTNALTITIEPIYGFIGKEGAETN